MDPPKGEKIQCAVMKIGALGRSFVVLVVVLDLFEGQEFPARLNIDENVLP